LGRVFTADNMSSEQATYQEVEVDDVLVKKFASNKDILPPDGNMFAKSLAQWEGLPVVHIKGDLCPTEERCPKTRQLIDRLLPLIEGQGCAHGAGFGPLHLVYFSGTSADAKWSKDNIPSCDSLLERMSISDSYKAYLRWFNVVDMTHQTIFPRNGNCDEDDQLRLGIENCIAEVDPEAPMLGVFPDDHHMPLYMQENFPPEVLLKGSRLLYLLVDCNNIHGYWCAKICPKNSSMVISRSTTMDPEDELVIKQAAFLYSNPQMALLQTSEGHILGLLTLDYLD
jgi:hypothetical protein